VSPSAIKKPCHSERSEESLIFKPPLRRRFCACFCVFVSPYISDSGGVAARVVAIGKIRDSSLRACGASLGMTWFF
jgi:hypothetical protein